MKLDVLAVGAHPDDVELGCSGTLAALIAKGNKVGVLDLTRGEMGTRGSAEIRQQEAEDASKIMGYAIRENADLPDVYFQNNIENQIRIAGYIRKYRPDVLITNAPKDRHPDHPKGSALLNEAWFIAGLSRLKIVHEDKELPPWRPSVIYHYIQAQYILPEFIVDISGFWNKKIESIRAYRSQFYDPSSKEPETYISQPHFLDFIEARCKQWGQEIGTEYGEGFSAERTVGVKDLLDLI